MGYNHVQNKQKNSSSLGYYHLLPETMKKLNGYYKYNFTGYYNRCGMWNQIIAGQRTDSYPILDGQGRPVGEGGILATVRRN